MKIFFYSAVSKIYLLQHKEQQYFFLLYLFSSHEIPFRLYYPLFQNLQHDRSIVAYLNALYLWDGKVPEFCSTLMYELHEQEPGEFYIRILYKNETNPNAETRVLKMKGIGALSAIFYLICYFFTYIIVTCNETKYFLLQKYVRT